MATLPTLSRSRARERSRSTGAQNPIVVIGCSPGCDLSASLISLCEGGPGVSDRVGQLLGNYRLVRLLGQGGFAQVYLGEHVRLGTQAAIKVLSTQLAAGDVQLFLTEARTIARLEHPHIIRILDFDIEQDIPFFPRDAQRDDTSQPPGLGA